MTKERIANTRTLDLDTRNTVLEHELQNVDQMARQLQTDKDMAITTGDKELLEAKVGVIEDIQTDRHQDTTTRQTDKDTTITTEDKELLEAKVDVIEDIQTDRQTDR